VKLPLESVDVSTRKGVTMLEPDTVGFKTLAQTVALKTASPAALINVPETAQVAII